MEDAGWADAAEAPSADVRVDAELLRALLAEQHPDLAALPLKTLANGWDNALLRVGEHLVARMPRRGPAAGLIGNEQRWLPELARLSPVPVPVPVRTGEPGCGYPYRWSITPWLPGHPAIAVAAARRTAAADGLAAFVAALAVPAPAEAPHNPYRGVPLAQRAASVLARLDSPHMPRRFEVRAPAPGRSCSPARSSTSSVRAPTSRGSPGRRSTEPSRAQGRSRPMRQRAESMLDSH